MTLRFHNTLTRRKEDFVPIDAARVRLYACGPTVYDNLHIGNGRMLIVFDVLFRLLRLVYGADRVVYVRNITDVDDKINARAAERGIDIRALTDEMIAIFHADAAALGCLPPKVEPRATDHIAPMIAIMRKLIANGHAYAAKGHVLFDVPSMPDYGRLANKSMDDQIAGARVEVAPYKRSPTDFVLWKPSAPDEPGWDSPWGRGRPGWHLECSAMSWQHLGETFDIHGGGIDLVFPHHENEIAQSRCAFGHGVMANVWMHNGHLQVESEKMSKSLGNFITIADLWQRDVFGGRAWSGDALRLAMLRTHYRQPIDFTLKALEEADRAVADFAKACAGVPATRPSDGFLAAMADDLNTPKAIAELYPLRAADPGALRAGLDLLGIVALAPLAKASGVFQLGETTLSGSGVGNSSAPATVQTLPPEAEALMQARAEARAAKNWTESDRLRDELAAIGIAVKDSKAGTTWERNR